MEFQAPIRTLKEKGFTLLELLVVIAVISMIIGLMVPNFMGARERARDAQRKSDLSQLQKALELYKTDQKPQSYPTGNFSPGLCGVCFGQSANCTSGNVYMNRFPCDPQNPTPYLYQRDNTDTLKYTISACLENEADTDIDPTPQAGCGSSYTVREP